MGRDPRRAAKKECEQLKINYQDCDNLELENLAISEKDGPRPLYKVKDECIDADWQRGRASFLARPGLEKHGMLATELVQCVTFDTLLNRHHVERIDLLQIDVEGYDYELLKLFDFGRIKPRLIRYEHRHLRLADRVALKERLSENGYQVLEMEYDTGAVLQPS
jgi:FkbM family methyltransferase